MTTEHAKPVPRFAICVDTDDPELLTPRMVNQVLPDEIATKSDHLRVIDNEGNDCLYPAEYFVLVSFPQQVWQVLPGTKAPLMRSVTRSRSQPTLNQEKSS